MPPIPPPPPAPAGSGLSSLISLMIASVVNNKDEMLATSCRGKRIFIQLFEQDHPDAAPGGAADLRPVGRRGRILLRACECHPCISSYRRRTRRASAREFDGFLQRLDFQSWLMLVPALSE